MEGENYLNTINELTINELRVAQKLYAYQGVSFPKQDQTPLEYVKEYQWKNLESFCKKQNIDQLFVLQRISNTGLIKEITGTYYGYDGGCYMITDAFRKLMSVIDRGNDTV